MLEILKQIDLRLVLLALVITFWAWHKGKMTKELLKEWQSEDQKRDERWQEEQKGYYEDQKRRDERWQEEQKKKMKRGVSFLIRETKPGVSFLTTLIEGTMNTKR